MTHRVDVVTVRIDDDYEDIVNTFKRSGRSRLPVYDHEQKDIIGLLYVRDLFLNSKEKDISKQLSDFYTSSPVYQDIEFILYICYSIVLHYSNIDQSISEKVSAIVQESMKSVCVLLKPLSQIAILQNQCINLFESHKSIRIRRSECIP